MGKIGGGNKDESFYFELLVQLISVFVKKKKKREEKGCLLQKCKGDANNVEEDQKLFYGERLTQWTLRSLEKGLLCCLCKPILCDFPLNSEVFHCCYALGNKDEKLLTIWLHVFNKIQVFL